MSSWKKGASAPTPGSPAAEGAEPDPHAVARSIVLRQLTASAKSRQQLAQKLAERDVPADVAAQVLDRFEEIQLIDDAEFACSWVRSRFQTRSLARGALQRELGDKGISAERAAAALEQITEDDERASAEALVARKLNSDLEYTDRSVRDKQTRRLVGMLARKGYSPSLAFNVVNDAIDDLLSTRDS